MDYCSSTESGLIMECSAGRIDGIEVGWEKGAMGYDISSAMGCKPTTSIIEVGINL